MIGVGDLVVCVKDGLGSTRAGKAYRVIGIVPPGCLIDGKINGFGEPALIFPHTPKGSASKSSRFRKIRPDEHEACEEEFRILLKLSKKRVAA